MIIIQRGQTVTVTDVDELGAANSRIFRSTVEAALTPLITQLTIDLAQTEFVDCSGLGALIALRNLALQNQNCSLCLENASTPVKRLFTLAGVAHLLAATPAARSANEPSSIGRLSPDTEMPQAQTLKTSPLFLGAVASLNPVQASDPPA